MTTTEQTAAPASRRNQGNRHTRRWLPFAGLVLLAVGLVAGLWPQPVPVETAPATLGTLRSVVAEDGKTRIKQRFVVSAPVAGQLRRIPFKAGAEVKARETVLATIDPLPPNLLDARARSLAEARLAEASANLEKARTALSWATSERGRFEKLFRDKTVSVQELEAAQFRETSAAKDMASVEGSLSEAQAQLSEFGAGGTTSTNSVGGPTEILAPADGRVLRVIEENSRVVTAGSPLVEIGDPADLEVVVEVLSRDGAAIAPGSKVEFEQWGGTKPLLGRVRLVEPAAFTKVSALGVEEQRVNVIADLLTPAQERPGVGDNFRVEARIITWEADHTLKVPAGALFRHGEQWAAFVLVDGRAQLRLLSTGRSSGVEMQVLDGLKPGEQVILYPGNRVTPGQRLRPIRI